mmetsp:Transcript_27017/g.47757  ORF Transcript_27017/g.47757 Transcript_27017/m.47757 type:complete len:84 (-) Transcript_27017:72-323(-)
MAKSRSEICVFLNFGNPYLGYLSNRAQAKHCHSKRPCCQNTAITQSKHGGYAWIWTVMEFASGQHLSKPPNASIGKETALKLG